MKGRVLIDSRSRRVVGGHGRDLYVVADPALDGVDKLVHLTWHKGGDVHRRIPASGALQSRVVAGIPVTEEMLDPPLQKVGVRPPRWNTVTS